MSHPLIITQNWLTGLRKSQSIQRRVEINLSGGLLTTPSQKRKLPDTRVSAAGIKLNAQFAARKALFSWTAAWLSHTRGETGRYLWAKFWFEGVGVVLCGWKRSNWAQIFLKKQKHVKFYNIVSKCLTVLPDFPTSKKLSSVVPSGLPDHISFCQISIQWTKLGQNIRISVSSKITITLFWKFQTILVDNLFSLMVARSPKFSIIVDSL